MSGRCLGDDRGGPAFECVGEFAREGGRHVEGGAVETSEECLPGVGDRAWIIRCGRNLDAAGGVMADDVDDLAEHGT